MRAPVTLGVAVLLCGAAAVSPHPASARQPRPLTVLVAGDSIVRGFDETNLRSALYGDLRSAGVPVRFVGPVSRFDNGHDTGAEVDEPAEVHTAFDPSLPWNHFAAVGGLCLLANRADGCGETVEGDVPEGIYGLVQATVHGWWTRDGNYVGTPQHRTGDVRVKGVTPDVIVVMGGINDRDCRLAPQERDRAGLQPCQQSFAARYRTFLDLVADEAPHAAVYFTTGRDFEGLDDFFDDNRAPLTRVATQLRAEGHDVHFVAHAWDGLRITYTDPATRTVDPATSDMRDALHPSDRGFVKLAANILAAMRPKLARWSHR